MATNTNTEHPTAATALWRDADLASYLGCSDPSSVSQLPGFPKRMDLPGVRGGRWFGPHVVAFFERLSSTGSGGPAADRPTAEVPEIPVFVPTSRKSAA